MTETRQLAVDFVIEKSSLKHRRHVQIGGVRAPSPVGELGNVEMTQATELTETKWECIGKDMLLTGDVLDVKWLFRR